MADSESPAAEFLEDWDRFCDALKQAGRVVTREATPTDELTAAEGFRHLLRMLRAGFEIASEFGDALHPELFPMASATLLSEGCTPDARYLQAFVDGSATHRITGSRGGSPLIEFGVYSGRTGIHEGPSDLLGCLTEAELEVGADGSVLVVLSPDEHPGNWIRTDERVRYVFIRQYAHDWSRTEEAVLRITREDSPSRVAPLDLLTLGRALEGTSRFVSTAPPFWAAISDYWVGYSVNQIVRQDQADSKTDITVPSGHTFACGWYQLEPDEALLVDFTPTEVPYWGLSLTNYWYESLGWGEGAACLNNQTVRYGPGGSVRIALADAPVNVEGAVSPGEGTGPINWMDTRGHRHGTAVFRWSRSDAPMPEFRCAVVPLETLRNPG